MRKNLYLPDVIQGIRDQIDRADGHTLSEAQIGHMLISMSQLTDLCEHLYQRIAELGKERIEA